MVATKLLLALYYFTLVIQYMVLAYVLLSWFVRPGNKAFLIYQKLGDILEPLFAPFRRITSGIAMRTGLDFTPFLLIVAVSLLYRLIYAVAVNFIV
ncbi:MAG: YggT family protein [Clostridia bacterium]|nr:YggT family protein [Clostridia bacterium]